MPKSSANGSIHASTGASANPIVEIQARDHGAHDGAEPIQGRSGRRVGDLLDVAEEKEDESLQHRQPEKDQHAGDEDDDEIVPIANACVLLGVVGSFADSQEREAAHGHDDRRGHKTQRRIRHRAGNGKTEHAADQRAGAAYA
jgi:hypothetical protein